MATTTQLKFYKDAYGATDAAKKSTDNVGGIVFDTTSKQIYVDGTSFGGNITDVTFSEAKLLTITKADDSTIKLDFSDTASASATMNVFKRLNTVIGKDITTGGSSLNYTGANYLNGYTEGETTIAAVTTLVDADMRLDALIKAINDEIAAMNGTATIASAADGVVTLKAGVKQTDGKIAQGDGDDITLAKVATTGESTDVAKSTDSGATYDTTDVSDDWKAVVEGNVIADGDTVDADINKLDNKVAGLADEVILNEKTTVETFGKIKESVGLSDNFTLDMSEATGADVKTATTVKKAILEVEKEITASNLTIDGHKGAITTGNGLTDVTEDGGSFGVKANGNYIEVTSDGVAVKNVDTTGDSTTETDLATVKTVTSHIDTLDVTEYEQAVISENKIEIKKIGEADGKIITTGATTINVDGTVSDTNPLATKKSIEDLDNNGETMASETDGVVTLYKQIKEADGIIDIDSADTNKITLAKVATTGKAEDVSYDDTTSKMGTTDNPVATAQKAIEVLDSRVDSLEALPKYDTVVSTNAATTPEGVKWTSETGEVTGTLAASATSMHKIYLVKTSSESGDVYAEYITVRQGTEGSYTYSWEKIGNTSADLEGYVKTIKLNGKEYSVDTNTNNITLTDVITKITGETPITSGNEEFIAVNATTTKTEADGTNETVISSTLKVQEIASATTTSNGLATALDVRNTIEGLDADKTSDDSAVATVEVKEVDGKITDVVVATVDAGLTYTKATETEKAKITATTSTGAVTGSAENIKAITDYVDDKVGTAIQSVTGENDSKTVTQDTYVNVEVDAETSTDNKVTLSSKASLNMATVTDDGSITTDGVATANNAKAIADKEIADIASVSNNDTDAGVKVEVTTKSGSVNAVDVAVTGATVTYTAKTDTDPANLAASDTTSVLTGAAIPSIKSYVDAQKADVTVPTDDTITVNSGTSTTLATVDGTAITAKATLVWEEWN